MNRDATKTPEDLVREKAQPRRNCTQIAGKAWCGTRNFVLENTWAQVTPRKARRRSKKRRNTHVASPILCSG